MTIELPGDVRRTCGIIYEKYILIVFLDVAGTFNNTWWPKILVQLRYFGNKGKDIKLIKNYFWETYALLKDQKG